MPRSMTGYGRGESIAAGIRVVVEARSVNHRFSEIVPRMPRSLMALEDRVRKTVSERVARGRVDLNITLERPFGQQKEVQVNTALATGYYAALTELSEHLGLTEPVRLSDVTSLPDVLVLRDNEIDPEEAWPLVAEALSVALSTLLEMRLLEGCNLVLDVMRRVRLVSASLEQIELRAPVVVTEYRDRLARRLAELLPSSSIDEQRLAMEVVLVAERGSIAEEIVRSKSHLQQIAETLKSDEAVGRKLDFLLQEVNREVNTISSKSSDLSIAESVVLIKSELEKIREQIQNLE